jgi:hypothetical protein
MNRFIQSEKIQNSRPGKAYESCIYFGTTIIQYFFRFVNELFHNSNNMEVIQ